MVEILLATFWLKKAIEILTPNRKDLQSYGLTEISDSTFAYMLIFYVNFDIWTFIKYVQDLAGKVVRRGRIKKNSQ